MRHIWKRTLGILMICYLFVCIGISAHAADGTSVKVTDYGANGSDSSDDWRAIQDALDLGQEATADKPLTVTIPSGTYYVSRALRIYSNTTLIADGATIKRTADNEQGLLRSGYLHTSLEGTWSSLAGGYDQLKNVTVQGGTWSGNVSGTKRDDGYTYSGKEPVNLMFFWHGQNITIKNLTITQCVGDHFLELSAVKNSTVSGVTFKDFIRYTGTDYDLSPQNGAEKEDGLSGTAIRSEAIQLDFAGKENSPLSYPFDNTGCQNITISGCTFDNCQSGVGTHHDNVAMSGITITGNTFKNMGSTCVSLPNMNATVSSNTATNVRAFARVNHGSTATFSNNTITYGFTSANNKISQDVFFISDSGTNVTLTGNTITGAGKRAVIAMAGSKLTMKDNTIDVTSFIPEDSNVIHLADVAGVEVSGNKVTGGNVAGFYLSNVSGTVSKNTVNSPASHAIRVADSTGLTLSNNTLNKAGGDGINTKNSTFTASGNKISSPANRGIFASGGTVTANGNTVTNGTGQGISLNACTGASTVSGNTISKFGANGIYVVACSKVTLSENTITDSRSSGIRVVDGSAATISNNIVDGSGNNGISENDSTVTVSGNTVQNTTGNGIYLDGGKGDITSNTVFGSTSADIKFANTATGTASKNTVATGGVKNSGTGKVTIKSDNVTKIEAAEMKSATATTDGIKVTWGTVSGAAKYRLYYRESGTSKWIKIGDTTATSYTWKKGNGGTTYDFTVVCLDKNDAACSSYDAIGVSATFPGSAGSELTKVTAVSNTDTGIKVTWSKEDGAAKYRLFYKTGSGKWTKIGDTTKTSYTWPKAQSGVTYSFTVRGLDSSGAYTSSSYDNTGMSITRGQLATPKITSITANGKAVTVKWGKVDGAAAYRLFYMKDGKWKALADTTGTSVTKNGAYGKTYTYTVRCISADGKSYTSAYDTKGVSFTLTNGQLATPKITSVTADGKAVTVKWGAVEGAAAYRVFYMKDGKWVKLADTTGTSITKDGTIGKTYTYTVRCISADGKSYTSSYDSKGVSITLE